MKYFILALLIPFFYLSITACDPSQCGTIINSGQNCSGAGHNDGGSPNVSHIPGFTYYTSPFGFTFGVSGDVTITDSSNNFDIAITSSDHLRNANLHIT